MELNVPLLLTYRLSESVPIHGAAPLMRGRKLLFWKAEGTKCDRFDALMTCAESVFCVDLLEYYGLEFSGQVPGS